MPRPGQGNDGDRQRKTLDEAVRKIERKEAGQDRRNGKPGKPVRSLGRAIRNGWKDNA